MKKLFLLLTAVLFVCSGLLSQNVLKRDGKLKFVGKDAPKTSVQVDKSTLLSEDFEGAALPTGWEVVDGDCGWLFSTDGSSDYLTIPAHTTYAYVNDDVCNGDMSDVWLITPSIDMTSATGVVLEFASFAYNDIFTIKASVDGGTTWTDIETLESSDAWTTITVDLSSVEGNADVKIAFHYNDNAIWGYGWAIDDVVIYELPPNDLAVVAVLPTFIESGSSAYPSVEVYNAGAVTQNDFDVSVVINDGVSDIYTSTLNVTGAALAPFSQDEFVMTDEWTTPADGNYVVTATVILTGDENNTNDELIGECDVIEFITAYAINGEGETFESVVIPTGEVTVISAFDTENFPMAMEFALGSYYFIRNSPAELYTVDVADGTTTLIAAITGMTGTPTGIAYNWNNSTMYIMFLDDSNIPHLGTIDLATGVATEIGTGTGMVIGMDFANDGTLYATTLDDVLVTIDIATGADTEVGALGFGINYGQDISYDIASGILYGIVYGDQIGLASFDLVTGAATVLVQYTAQYACFAIPFLIGPQVVSVTPENGATNVALDATVAVTFDVNITEVDFAGITITPDPGNVTASIVDNVLTIAHDNFEFNTEYTVLIPAGAVSDGVDNLAYDVEWSFTTMLDPDACNDPSDIVISDITISGATVTWTENGVGTAWTVVYGPVGFDPATEGDQVAADVTTADLTGLESDTEYEVYVQAICGAETSGWAGPVQFTTLFDCGPAINTLPYTNAFDVEDPCWIVVQSNVNETWSHDGTGAYQCSYDEALGAQDELLESPEFDLSGYSTDNIAAKFTWSGSYYWSVDPENNYDLFFKVSTDGTNWTSLWDETVPGVFENWTEYLAIVDVSAYAGESSVWFAFNYVGTDGAQWLIHDFALEITTGLDVNNSNIVSVYPNPSNGLVNINVTENSVVSVVDIAGRVVESFEINANEEVNFSQSAGLYFVKVESNGKVSTHKLIIQ